MTKSSALCVAAWPLWALVALGCGSGSKAADVPAADVPYEDEALNVRFSGGETSDFGNGSDDPCGTRTTATDIGAEEARSIAGADIDAEASWLAEVHRAPLLWASAACAAPESCEATEVELRAQIDGYVRVDGRSTRPDYEGCESEWQTLVYRATVGLRTADGRIDGAFHAQLGRRDGEVYTRAVPDLRNFQGSLPLLLDLERTHHSYLNVGFQLRQDGATTGSLEPSIAYFDGSGAFAEIGPAAQWDSLAPPPVPEWRAAPGADAVTLSSYEGSPTVPSAAVVVGADAGEAVRVADAGAPSTDVDVTIRVNDEVIREGSVPAGTRIELGEQPFGTRVSLAVRNTHGASFVRATIGQPGCVGVVESCDEAGCEARAELESEFRPCLGSTVSR